MIKQEAFNIEEVLSREVQEAQTQVSDERVKEATANAQKEDLRRQLMEAELVASQEESTAAEAREIKEQIAEITGGIA